MLRATILHLLLLIAPTLLFFIYLLITRKISLSSEKRSEISKSIPWVPLISLGAILVIASLVAISLSGGGGPDRTYNPPFIEDGKVVPASIE